MLHQNGITISIGGGRSECITHWYNLNNLGSSFVDVTGDVTKISYSKSIWTAVERGFSLAKFNYLHGIFPWIGVWKSVAQFLDLFVWSIRPASCSWLFSLRWSPQSVSYSQMKSAQGIIMKIAGILTLPLILLRELTCWESPKHLIMRPKTPFLSNSRPLKRKEDAPYRVGVWDVKIVCFGAI